MKQVVKFCEKVVAARSSKDGKGASYKNMIDINAFRFIFEDLGIFVRG